MKKALAIVALTLALVGSALAVIHYKHKHEDDVAYFALKTIKKDLSDIDAKCAPPDVYQEHCLSTKAEMRVYLQTHTDVELLTESMDCLTRNFQLIDACHQRTNELQEEEFRGWAEKYPRQTANLKRDALENARKQDARQAEAK